MFHNIELEKDTLGDNGEMGDQCLLSSDLCQRQVSNIAY